MEPSGLRERKKRRTRDQLVDSARRLFVERGFEAVTVADVAAEAEVAESTVFNYFGTKEDLFFDGLEAFEEQLISAVEGRAERVSVLEVFRDLVVDGAAGLASVERIEGAAMAARLIGDSPSLRRRELEIVASYTDTLAELLAGEAGAADDEIEPKVVAHTLMAIHRVIVEMVRTLATEGVPADEIATRAAGEAARAFNILGHGIVDYGRR
jgi:AcrR family transcriptional regulator